METLIKKDTRQLRRELQDGNSEALKSRRRIFALSLLGIGAMTAANVGIAALSFIEGKKAWRNLAGN